MANSRKSTRKSGNVTQLPGPSDGVGVAEPPEEGEAPTEATAAPPNPPRPPKKTPKDQKGPETDPNFFQRLKSIPRDDWGTRVFLYLYVLEPLCNLKQSGGKTYLNRYSEPVQDEHQIMLEYGSGRYRLMLSQNKISPEASNELARYEFEVLNSQYPPKIPRAAWINDSRNAKWEALLPKETAATPASAASTIVDAMKMVSDIRRDVREEMEPEAAETQSPSEMVNTFKAMKDILTPATTATAAKDPLELATALATTMMQMKADNPVIDLYRDELKALREEMKEERASRAAQAVPAVEKPKTLIEQLTDFKALRDIFTTATGAEGTIRAGRTTALDVARDLGSKFFESDLAMGVGQYLASLATRNVSGNPAQMNPGAPQNGVQRPIDDFAAFIENVLNPALLRHYIQGFTGGEFAGWLYDGYPDRVVQLQNFTHPMMPGLRGQNAIVQAYKNTPNMWPTLSSARPEGESAFVHFVHEFCQWKPEPNEPIDVQPIEHDGEQEEEGPERI